ncbi:hypothetical protein [Flavivirga algicola]|uniref:NVEALA family protein n=1 Tax=Flavivirga algicola TaxID=2729136 RepID=A0ABX1RZG8_9FLAO|nr:hypothetical protein [Flavivirga algicola]NMH87589.1 hypothetical protein [Flavivirga algicola]
MKKIIGFIGIAITAMTLFFGTNMTNSYKDLDLASLIATNVANAESQVIGCSYTGSSSDTCQVFYPNWVNIQYCKNEAIGYSCYY